MENTVPTPAQSAGRSTFAIHEDWVSVILGFLIIIISLLWFVVPVPSYTWDSWSAFSTNVMSGSNISAIVGQFLYVGIIGTMGILLTGKPLKSFLLSFPVVYIVTLAALIIEGNGVIKGLNLEAVIFSLSIGLLISNLFKLPEWFRAALSTELFVKIGLVLLGTRIIFSDILESGSLGLIQ